MVLNRKEIKGCKKEVIELLHRKQMGVVYESDSNVIFVDLFSYITGDNRLVYLQKLYTC